MQEQTDNSTDTGALAGAAPSGAISDPSVVKYDAKGLVPCVVQEWNTGEVLMLAYMNAESLRRTLETGTTWFYSRSRQEYWNKGATSGHFQKVRELRYDCDGDTLLAIVEQTGAACHTGDFTCFDGRWLGSPPGERPPFLARRLPENDAALSEGDGCEREKNAGSARSSATGATEDALSSPPVHSDGRGFVLRQPPTRER
jgi:phosphoribosyl-AMP cyclohydrolase